MAEGLPGGYYGLTAIKDDLDIILKVLYDPWGYHVYTDVILKVCDALDVDITDILETVPVNLS
jgi:hypothetical protein